MVAGYSDILHPSETNLIGYAQRIPSMGGLEIGSALQQFSADAPSGTSIVEVGTWLGAGTAQIALGVRQREVVSEIEIHCFDRWKASDAEVTKARPCGLNLTVGMDLLPIVRNTLKRFDVVTRFHQGDVICARWDAGPISVYIDDAAKKWRDFYHMLRTFGPHWIPGETVVVLMDYEFWKTRESLDYRCQLEFIESNRSCFEPIDCVSKASKHGGIMPVQPAAFRYTDKINFEQWIATSSMRRLVSAQSDIKKLNSDVRLKNEKLASLYNSTSWQITSPLRRCSDIARAMLGFSTSSE